MAHSPSVYDAFEAVAREAPRKAALVYLGESVAYAELEGLCSILARALADLGLRPRDRAVIYLPTCPQWIIVWLALQKVGAVAVPVHHYYSYRELEYIVVDSEAKFVFCADTNYGYVAQILGEAPSVKVVVSNLADLLPWWKRGLGRLMDRLPSGRVALQTNVLRLKDLLHWKQEAKPFVPEDSAGVQDLAEIVYTDGTTGYPKGVPVTHALLLRSTSEQRKASELIVPRGKDTVIQGTPLCHVFGQVVGFGALLSGETLVLLPRMNLDALFDHIVRYRATTIFGTPTLFQMILRHERRDQYDLSCLQYCLSSGDVLPAEVQREWVEKVGRPLYQAYGTTEACGPISLTLPGEEGPEAGIGRPLAYWEVRVADPETLTPVEVGEVGELLVRSETMVTSYWNKPEETSEQFVTIDGKVWYRTGDLVSRDREGRLFFVDRSVDVIKHKGYRIAPSKIERVLQEHPSVATACVVGIPGAETGETIKAFVVLKGGARGTTAYDLVRWCRERLAPFEVPQHVEFRDTLPKSKTGKLLRRELRSEERRKLRAS
ncbi:MAG: class I adenylate-forming enzyme family protein [Clostridia bacterium]|jgi:long-chain acyl-CoA synthetase|nr:acyl--CoA ligase [Clostridia bacterium]MDH7573101.1 class I adenylate-forming enzyme family protein [Clostridia bacterium]